MINSLIHVPRNTKNAEATTAFYFSASELKIALHHNDVMVVILAPHRPLSLSVVMFS